MPAFRARHLAYTALAAAFGLLAHPAAPAAAAPTYRLVKTVKLSDPTFWDYVVADSATHRVYIAHADGLTVVDGTKGAVVGEVKGFPGGTHGIAISMPTGRGYTDDGENGLVKSFDLKTLKVKKTIKAEMDADALALDPASGHIFVMDGDSGKVTVVDPVTDTAIAEFDGGGKLEYATADGAGNLYINGAGKKEILRVDTATNKITARWPVPDCESPHGMAIDAPDHRVFTNCVNKKLIVLNTDTGAVVATLPIDRGPDAAAYDAKRHRVLSSNGIDGTLTVIQQSGPDAYKVIDTVKTQVMGRTMGLDESTGRVFIAAATLDPNSPPVGYPRSLPGTFKLMIFDPTAASR